MASLAGTGKKEVPEHEDNEFRLFARPHARIIEVSLGEGSGRLEIGLPWPPVGRTRRQPCAPAPWGRRRVCPEELWIIFWTASTRRRRAGVGDHYEVQVNGTIIGVIPAGTQTVSYTEALGANTVTIVAVDEAGNTSAPRNPITVLTNWAPGGCGF